MNKSVLSPGDAMNLGELLTAIGAKKKVRWVTDDGNILTAELRCLVTGKADFSMPKFGTDVRDMWVWLSAGVCEYTESVERLVSLMPEGGFAIEP